MCIEGAFPAGNAPSLARAAGSGGVTPPGARTTWTVIGPPGQHGQRRDPAGVGEVAAGRLDHGTCSAGAITVAVSTSARIDSFASDFALRTAASTSAASGHHGRVTAGRQLGGGRPGARCTEPSATTTRPPR